MILSIPFLQIRLLLLIPSFIIFYIDWLKPEFLIYQPNLCRLFGLSSQMKCLNKATLVTKQTTVLYCIWDNYEAACSIGEANTQSSYCPDFIKAFLIKKIHMLRILRDGIFNLFRHSIDSIWLKAKVKYERSGKSISCMILISCDSLLKSE